MLYFENPDFINSSEAMSNSIYLGNKTVIIPFYNLALMKNNPINNKASFVRQAFYILENVEKIVFHSEGSHFRIMVSDESSPRKEEFLIVGGYENLMMGAEIQVCYTSSSLAIPANSFYSHVSIENIKIIDELPSNMISKVGINYYRIII